MKKNNGFTLVELIAVIVIMGIIFIITIPQIQKTSINSKIKLCQNKLSLIEDSLNLFLSTNATYEVETTRVLGSLFISSKVYNCSK